MDCGFIQTRVEKVAPKDMQKRLKALERSAVPAKRAAAKTAAKRKPAVKGTKASLAKPRRKTVAT